MTDYSLTTAELACLRRLEREPDAQQPCSQAVLDRLVRKGLVEQRPLLCIPIVPQRCGYHLTAAGRQALAKHNASSSPERRH